LQDKIDDMEKEKEQVKKDHDQEKLSLQTEIKNEFEKLIKAKDKEIEKLTLELNKSQVKLSTF
jgi:hypothetical protein